MSENDWTMAFAERPPAGRIPTIRVS